MGSGGRMGGNHVRPPVSRGFWDRARAWLWDASRGSGRWRGAGVRTLQVAWLSVENALNNRLPFQASALTFVTLLGMVPALALVFALAKGFGFAETLRGLLVENLSDYQREILERVLVYVENTRVGTLGAVGLVLLLGTIVTTIASVEDTFNQVWHVREQRPWGRRVTNYLSILVVVPLLVVAAAATWAGLSSNAIVTWLQEVAVIGDLTRVVLRLVPVLALCAAFSFLITYLPNTRVPVRSALVAGLVAAVLWWAMQTIYIRFQVGVAKYNAIYGGFASLPLFMAWLQVSWTIVLVGAEVAHAHHLCGTGYRPAVLARVPTPHETERLTVFLMESVAGRFDRGEPAPVAADLAPDLGLDPGEVEALASPLLARGLLAKDGEGGGLRPGRSLDHITLADVVTAVHGGSPAEDRAGRGAILLDAADEERTRRLGRVTLQDLVRGQEA